RAAPCTFRETCPATGARAVPTCRTRARRTPSRAASSAGSDRSTFLIFRSSCAKRSSLLRSLRMDRLALCVDLGGTKIEGGAVRLEPFGELARLRVPTERQEGYEAVLDRTARAIRTIAKDAGVEVASIPIGVGMPGGTTRREGLVKNSNTTCLNGRPFRQDLA